MKWRLRMQLQEIDLPLGRTILGREPECPITLDDPLVSRRHAALLVSSTGCTLQDLGSRNGVWVNGRRIDGPVRLEPNDRVRLGRDELVLLHVAGEETMTSERDTGRMQSCALCGHEHVENLASCPACGLDAVASSFVADFLQYTEQVAARTRSGVIPRYVLEGAEEAVAAGGSRSRFRPR